MEETQFAMAVWIGDSWATFVDIQTGEEISCAEFYAQMQQQQAK